MSLLHKADVPCGRKLGLQQASSAQRTALYPSALYGSFWKFCVRSFENRAVSWVCFPTLPWSSCFAGKLVKSVVPQLCLVFAVLQPSSMSVCLWGFGTHFYLPFERASSPITHSDGWRWEVFWQPFFSNGDVCQEDSYLCTSQCISFLKWLFPAEEKIDSL